MAGSVRVDAGVEEGDEIGLAYDPIDRRSSSRTGATAARRSTVSPPRWRDRVDGVTTNLPFLRWLVSHPVVRAGETTTAFLTEHPPLYAIPLLRPGPVERPWRLNLPSPAPAPRRMSTIRAPAPRSGGWKQQVIAPMPGTVIRVEVEPGERSGRASRSSCWRR